jgi:hypothetical protein
MISVETTAVIGTCVHEDGGRAAIFENIEHLKTVCDLIMNNA